MQLAVSFFSSHSGAISVRPSECACYQRDHKKHQEYVKDNFRDRSRSCGYPRKSKDSSDKRYHQKCQCPA